MRFPISLPLCRRKPLDALKGRCLGGLCIEGSTLKLRLREGSVSIGLEDRTLTNISDKSVTCWIVLPGWMRIRRVIQDKTQIIIEGGELYTTRISIRCKNNEWKIVFPSTGRF